MNKNRMQTLAGLLKESKLDETPQNERLCAAAPEMVKALKHCYDLLGRYEINSADEAADIIRSVIKKATGEVLPW